MKTIYVYSCLLFALSVVEMKSLSITGHVGGNVTIECSDWDSDVKHNVKYFCDSPCTQDKHTIIKAEFGKTEYKNRIEVSNTADGLFVTFSNLQESDSKTYYCGVERYGFDLYIKVNLKVTKDDSITSNSSDNKTDMSTSHTTLNTMLPTAPATGGAGYVPYLTAGVASIITIVMVVLILARKKMKKQQALSVVEMKPLSITGHVGKSAEIKCSDWDAWTNVKHNVKYFCYSPCTEDKHIIVKAEFGKTKKYKNRIEVTNTAEGFFVTFSNLQELDSKTYYCGAERFGRDSFIKVNLKVTKDDSIMSSNSSDNMTDMSTSHTTLNTMSPTASATGGAGHAPYLILGVIVLAASLVVLLKFMCKMMKQLKVVSSAGAPQEDAREGVEYAEIRPETLTDPDCLYANYSYQQHTELTAESSSKDVSSNSASRCEVSSRGPCAESRGTDPQCDLVYSVAQLPKVQIEPTGQSESNQFEIENDSFYSLAQLPQAT
ncbi:hypothetical protein ABVT39_015362 [Epinephelus coioides]